MCPPYSIIIPEVPSRGQAHPITSIFTPALPDKSAVFLTFLAATRPLSTSDLRATTSPTQPCNSRHCSSPLRQALPGTQPPITWPFQTCPSLMPSLSPRALLPHSPHGSQAFTLQAPSHHQALDRLLPLSPLWGTPTFPSELSWTVTSSGLLPSPPFCRDS